MLADLVLCSSSHLLCVFNVIEISPAQLGLLSDVIESSIVCTACWLRPSGYRCTVSGASRVGITALSVFDA